MKNRARRIFPEWEKAALSANNLKVCSCHGWGCSNIRRNKHLKTIDRIPLAEKKFHQSANDQEQEYQDHLGILNSLTTEEYLWLYEYRDEVLPWIDFEGIGSLSKQQKKWLKDTYGYLGEWWMVFATCGVSSESKWVTRLKELQFSYLWEDIAQRRRNRLYDNFSQSENL